MLVQACLALCAARMYGCVLTLLVNALESFYDCVVLSVVISDTVGSADSVRLMIERSKLLRD